MNNIDIFKSLMIWLPFGIILWGIIIICIVRYGNNVPPLI
jgi:hypothetical protein